MGRPRGLRGGNSSFAAANRGSLGAARHIVRTRPGAVAATDGNGATALHRAAVNSHVEICRVLLSAGAAVDAREWLNGLLAEDCAAGSFYLFHMI